MTKDKPVVTQRLEAVLKRVFLEFDFFEALSRMGYDDDQIEQLSRDVVAQLCEEIVTILKAYARAHGHAMGWDMVERWFGLLRERPEFLSQIGEDYRLTPAQVAYRVESVFRLFRNPQNWQSISHTIADEISAVVGALKDPNSATKFAR